MPIRPTILLLPGLLCDAASWEAPARALSALADCRIADYGALDSIPAMAEHVLETAPPRFLLAGHSMGGRVALEVYRRAAERIDRLALLDTAYAGAPGGTATEGEADHRLALLELARTRGMRAAGERWAQAMAHPARRDDPALLEALAAMVERKNVEIFAAQVQAMLGRPDAGPLLSRIACPTLVACGRQDSLSPLARNEEMAGLIPGAVLAAVEDAGHMVAMERPAEVSALLHAWFLPALKRST